MNTTQHAIDIRDLERTRPEQEVGIGNRYMHKLHGPITITASTEDKSTFYALSDRGIGLIVCAHMLGPMA